MAAGRGSGRVRWLAAALALLAGGGLVVGMGRGLRAAGAQAAPSAAAQARVAAARRGFEQARAEWRLRTRASGATAYTWSRRWLDAQRAASPAAADQVAAFKAHRDRMRELTRSQEAAAGAGLLAGALVLELNYYRAEADFWADEAAQGRIPPPVP